MRWLSWILLLPIAIAVIVFSVYNRGVTNVDFWPFGFVVELPVFAIVLTSLLLGFVLGGLVAWLSYARVRRQARLARREAQDARRELVRMRQEASQPRENKRKESLLPPPADAA